MNQDLVGEIIKTNQKQIKSHPLYKIFFVVFGTALLVSLCLVRSVKADTINLSKGYKTTQNLQIGNLVSLNQNNTQYVVLADNTNLNNLLGVVVSQNASNINFSASASSVQIGISGTYSVDVTDINGSISTGDKLTASPIEGFAMKATTAVKIIGVAEQAFNSSSTGASTESVTGDNGRQISISVGAIPVIVTAEYWTGPPNTSSDLAQFIAPVQNFLSSVVNKPVSQLKAFIALIVVSVSLVVAIIILMSSMVTSVRSIGRNPLARRSITNHLVFVIILVMAIIGASISAAYLTILG